MALRALQGGGVRGRQGRPKGCRGAARALDRQIAALEQAVSAIGEQVRRAASAKEGHVKVSDDVGSPVGSSERPDEAILGRAAESHEGVAKCAATLSGRKQAYSREGRRRSAQVPRKRGWDRTHVIVLGANPVQFI